MRIIIAPAKKMTMDTDSIAPAGLPQFMDEAEQLKAALQSLTDEALKQLWRCNSGIAKLNTERLRTMNVHRNLTPALLAYQGLQYQYMAPNVFDVTQFEYIQKHLRILSGFYGLLRPFDGVAPYRLEMQAALCVAGCRDLYDYWGSKLADQLAGETDLVLNLASKEYSRAVEAHLPPSVRFVTCVFGELKNGKVHEKGTICKMARGQMVRWLAENNVTEPEDVKAFDNLGYRYARDYSDDTQIVFIKEGGSYAGGDD